MEYMRLLKVIQKTIVLLPEHRLLKAGKAFSSSLRLFQIQGILKNWGHKKISNLVARLSELGKCALILSICLLYYTRNTWQSLHFLNVEPIDFSFQLMITYTNGEISMIYSRIFKGYSFSDWFEEFSGRR